MKPRFVFPNHFLWGTATSAYQIEGSHAADGKGLSVWDEFVTRGKKICNGDRGDLGCDHYKKYREDVGLMKTLGYPGYRFSISWPRVQPNGVGAINPAGIDFYDRLVDELLSNNILPFATLYHWDLPWELEKTGGWMNRATAERFGDYTENVVQKLGDRVNNWITINEPWIIYVTGYILGIHPPGQFRPYSGFRVAHNLLLAHGLAVQRIRSINPESKVGITNALSPVHSYRLDRGEKTVERAHAIQNSLWMDSVFKGQYPSIIQDEILSQLGSCFQEGDMSTISTPTDFVGVNHYTRTIVRWAPVPIFRFIPVRPKYQGLQTTGMDWEIYPQGLKEILDWIRTEYGNPPVYITENGAAFQESPDTQGIVNDWERIRFLESYLTQVHHSIAEGSDIRGYFVWSFLDNFEWYYGYAKTFGLVHVDRSSHQLTRTPKQSAHWYSHVCQNNGF